MTQPFSQTIHRLDAKPATTFLNLSHFPLLSPKGTPHAAFRTLREAQEGGCFTITEVSEHGTVPTLLAENSGNQPVLLVDGEELIGAKQNRILNLTILVPAKTSLQIPVSCVEVGRWSYQSRHFARADRTAYASLRAKKAAQVSASLHRSSHRQAEQGEVWRDIAEKHARTRTQSATGAMGDIFSNVSTEIGDFVQGLPIWPNQVGAIFAIDGRVRGLELFGSVEVWAAFHAQLVRSYALDAIDARKRAVLAPDLLVARHFLESVAGIEDIERYGALGLGNDLRAHNPEMTVAGLEYENTLVHLSAFPIRNLEASSRVGGEARIHTPASRRRAWAKRSSGERGDG
jgi:hypothetical protein